MLALEKSRHSLRDRGGPRGATWGPEDTIIVATNIGTTGLQRVAAGGLVTVLTRPDRAQGELDHLWPELLPGGRAVLFTITAQTGGLDAAQVAVLDLQTGTRKILVRGGTHARYVPNGLGSPTRAEREDGHLVYVAAGTLRAVAFDLARLELRGCGLRRGRTPRDRFELLDETDSVGHDVNAVVTLSVQDYCRPGRADFGAGAGFGRRLRR